MLLASLKYSNSAKLFPEHGTDSQSAGFRPSRALPNGHLQTLASIILPVRQPLPPARIHQLDTTMGDRLVLHENRPPGDRDPRRDVLLLHGVGGSHASPYVIRTAELLLQRGFRVWRLDQRGCGAGAALARHHHHAGRVEDLDAAIGRIARLTESTGRLSLVGFSLGGNLLLNWLTNPENDRRPEVEFAIAVAPPIDLHWCVTELGNGLGRWYDLFFGKALRSHLLERRRLRPDMYDRAISPIPVRLFDFDDLFTAPLGGFADAADYYHRCSSINRLSRIRTTTLIVADRDDPVVPFEIFSGYQDWPGIHLVTTSGGGHVGYVARRGIDQTRFWIGWRICDWLTGFHPAGNGRAP